MSLLEVQQLSRRFGGLAAVNDVNFSVEEGEILAVIGPNGAGKSTLFKLITSFLRPSSGRVVFRGEEISGLRPHIVARKGVVRTFQETTIFREMTALQNVVVAHHLRTRASSLGIFFNSPAARADEASFRDSAAEILDYLGLGAVKDTPARGLPHGYLRALGIALAMAAEPKVLLLDEPFSGMNPEETDRAVRYGPGHPRSRCDRAPGRARHVGGDADQRPHRRAQLRHQDRGGAACRNPAGQGGDRGISRERGRGALSAYFKMQDVSVRYDKVRALRHVSLRLGQGQIVCLIGTNGAGKTTSLRAITGLAPLASGEIHFDGRRIDRMRPEQIVAQGIAMVPEGRHVYPYMSVRDNLLMGAYLRHDKAAIRADLDKAFARFPRLKERIRQQAGTLSGGEQQMVAMSRALMARPKLLLLDEPSLGLAPMLVREIARAILTINREDQVSVVLVEQNSRMALRISSHAYVLETGRVALSGPSAELIDNDHVRRLYLGG